METTSPVSTNGDSTFMLEQPDETIMISIPAHAWLTGYVGDGEVFDSIQLELNLRTLQLTHPSAMMGYTVFRQNCQALSIPTVSFQNWMKAATNRCRMEHDRMKESRSPYQYRTGATITL
jgi:hypothetical protein